MCSAVVVQPARLKQLQNKSMIGGQNPFFDDP